METAKITVSRRLKTILEFSVYNLADQFWTEYEGGTWLFSNEGMYWYPIEEKVEICNPYNYFEGVLKPKAAGIAFTIMACSSLSMEFFRKKSDLSEFWSEYYYSLIEYTYKNFSEEDQRQIFSFLD